jgi:hypothetical protein
MCQRWKENPVFNSAWAEISFFSLTANLPHEKSQQLVMQLVLKRSGLLVHVTSVQIFNL